MKRVFRGIYLLQVFIFFIMISVERYCTSFLSFGLINANRLINPIYLLEREREREREREQAGRCKRLFAKQTHYFFSARDNICKARHISKQSSSALSVFIRNTIPFLLRNHILRTSRQPLCDVLLQAVFLSQYVEIRYTHYCFSADFLFHP
jgi:hypothetical protein